MLSAFPMILVAVVLYNLVAFGNGFAGHADMQTFLAQSFVIKSFSGDMWRVTLNDLFLLLALAMLFIETIKATRTTHREIANHAFSMLTFVVALVEFIVLKGFSTSAFFFIVAMSLFDVVAGYTISIIAAKRDLGVAPRDYD